MEIREKQIIPVVFATDNNYAPMTGVALYSMMVNASPDYFYDVYIFNTNLSGEHKRRLENLSNENTRVQVTDVKEHMFVQERHTSNHLSIEAVYRLLIPDVLPEYKKVMYLDGDIVVTGDIAEFYASDIEGYVLGAIHEPIYDWTDQYWREHLNLHYADAFNSGIILINTEQFRKEKIKEKCIRLLEDDWMKPKKVFEYLDQDVLNITCSGKVKFLSPVWNLQCQMYIRDIKKIYDEYAEEFEQAHKDPKIIHYAGLVKPWKQPEAHLSDVFWKYARETDFYEEIVYNNLKVKGLEVGKCFERYVFPYQEVPQNSNVIIYGAGDVGQAFISQITLTKWCNAILWVDKNYEKLKQSGMVVASPELMQRIPFDLVIIAIKKEDISRSIREYIRELGIEDEKIVWANPCGKV